MEVMNAAFEIKQLLYSMIIASIIVLPKAGKDSLYP